MRMTGNLVSKEGGGVSRVHTQDVVLTLYRSVVVLYRTYLRITDWLPRARSPMRYREAQRGHHTQ